MIIIQTPNLLYNNTSIFIVFNSLSPVSLEGAVELMKKSPKKGEFIMAVTQQIMCCSRFNDRLTFFILKTTI